MRSMEYPFTNDWRRGCWVARPTGRPDPDFVYDREWLRGETHKQTGLVRYTLDDLGGPGWVVAKDRRRIRSLIKLGDLEWTDYGETTPADVLRVVNGTWDGARCETCELGVILEGETECVLCARETADRARVAKDRAETAAVRGHTDIDELAVF